MTSFYLEDDLYHGRRADWQALDTGHNSRMTVFDAKELNEEICDTVRDGGMLGKLLGRRQNNA